MINDRGVTNYFGGCVVGARQYRMFWQLASSNTYLVVAMSKK